MASEAMAGQPEREDQAQEDADLGGSVDPGSLEQLLWYPDEEVPEEEDGERESERRMEEHDREDRVEDPEGVVEREHGDQRHLQWHDQKGDDEDEEPVAAGEVEPRERVAREGGDEDWQDRPPDRDPERRPERRGDRIVLEDGPVVVERQVGRLHQERPPAVRRELGGIEQRDDEEADRRDQPEEADDDEQDVDRRLAEHADDPRRELLLDDGRWSRFCGGGCHRSAYTSLLKRRTFRSRIGITRMKRNTAIAEPKP